MCEDTNLKAIHNVKLFLSLPFLLSSMCEDTNLKAIHNGTEHDVGEPRVVFNVRRY